MSLSIDGPSRAQCDISLNRGRKKPASKLCITVRIWMFRFLVLFRTSRRDNEKGRERDKSSRRSENQGPEKSWHHTHENIHDSGDADIHFRPDGDHSLDPDESIPMWTQGLKW